MDNASQNQISNQIFAHPPQQVLQNIFVLMGNLDIHGKVAGIGGSIFDETKTDPTLLTGQVFAHTVFWQSSENDAALLEKAIQKAATGENESITLGFRVNSSLSIPLELYIYPAKDEHGVTNGIYIYGRKLGKEETVDVQGYVARHLLAAAEEAEIGLWFWDYKVGKIFSTRWCNELLGLSQYETFTYDHFFSIVHPDDRDRVSETLDETRRSGTKYEIEFRVLYPHSGIEWINSEGKAMLGSDGKPRQMMGIFRKITEEKEAAEELAKIYERETRSREEAVEANRAKDFFLAFVSHELRSPLNAILGWSKILLTKEVDDATRKNALETIERSASVQAKLINDLVDSARVASGKIRLEYRPANLYEMLRGAFEAQRPAAEARSIELEFTAESQDVIVFADVNRMLQVFSNLLTNALKFTHDGGSIGIDLKTKDDEAVIVIKDNGEGISEDSLMNIFGQFSQGEMPKRRSSGGLGLGLSIAKTLVEKHGGSIQAESEGEGEGSTFTITLPINNSQQAVQKTVKKEINGKPLERVRVMIVEDDPDSREVLQLFLQQSGATVIAASDAGSAKKLILSTAKNLPDVMVSDLAMPDEDGYSLIAHIRSLPPSKGGNIPAIALSAFATNESRQRAIQAGFQQYLTKPFEPEVIVEEIRKLYAKNNGE